MLRNIHFSNASFLQQLLLSVFAISEPGKRAFGNILDLKTRRKTVILEFSKPDNGYFSSFL
jgi:hypothetical protein